MFGDILTDEASMLTGSMGMLPSASLGAQSKIENRQSQIGLYEPIHGSAPDIAGQGKANPLATILSVALLLRHSLGLEDEARAVEAAVERTIEAGYLTADIAGAGQRAYSTEAVGAKVAEQLA
jgi:3-isopropylmalate dehydrogenase